MTRIYQETLAGRWRKIPQGKKAPCRDWWFIRKRTTGGKFIPPDNWRHVFPTRHEILTGRVNWHGLRLMVQAVKRVSAGEDPQRVADDIRPQSKLPGL